MTKMLTEKEERRLELGRRVRHGRQTEREVREGKRRLNTLTNTSTLLASVPSRRKNKNRKTERKKKTRKINIRKY